MENPIIHTIEILGDYSFGIYLMHPVMTFILRRFIHVTQPFLILAILMVAYVLMMLICIGIIKILRINKWTNVIIGEYILWKLPNKNIYENTV